MNPKCHVCQSEQSRFAFQAPLEKFTKAMGRKKGVDYYFCEHCTVLFQYPIFDQNEYKDFYENKQRSDETGYKSGEVPKDHLKKKQIATDFKWNHMKLLEIEALIPGKRIFELGPAEGTLLATFRDKGYQVKGIEPLAPYARYAREVFKLDVTEGYFDAEVAAREKADMVILDGVLEHLTTPFEMLKLVKQVLSPNGILYMGGLPIAEFATPYMANISHITLWTRRAIAFTLQCAGFQPLDIWKGRPAERAAEWVCASQSCLEPRDIVTAQPTLYPAVKFEDISAHWRTMVDQYNAAVARQEKYGPAYPLLARVARKVPGARALAKKFL